MVYSSYKLQRILYYYLRGNRSPMISRLLRKENLKASRIGIAKFLKKYKETGCIGRSGSGRPSKFTAEIKAIVNEQMRKDNETTAMQLHVLLVSRVSYLSENNPSLSHLAWLDLSWEQLLPAHSCTEQREEAGIDPMLQNVQG